MNDKSVLAKDGKDKQEGPQFRGPKTSTPKKQGYKRGAHLTDSVGADGTIEDNKSERTSHVAISDRKDEATEDPKAAVVGKKYKTFSLKAADVKKTWFLIDAKDLVLGRLASYIANILQGKTKVTYTPHVDCGDNVIVINAKYIHLTGKKWRQKIYYRHTGYPGGIKEQTALNIVEGRFPDRILRKAVDRMLQNGPLGRKQRKNLRIYAGEKHEHQAQNPVTLNFSNKNPKNIKRG